MSVFANVDTKYSVLKFFEEISSIPRCSGNMDKISSYLVNFAKKRNLEYIKDESKNVIIYKKSQKGYENVPTIMLQSHIDMVCEKTDNSSHDFLKDGIKIIVEGDKVKANLTTLGADNGVGMSYMLSILDSNDFNHPDIEAFFTTDEETTMYGVENLDPAIFKSKYLINLDSEEEGIVTLGCAGGFTTYLKVPHKREKINGDYIKSKITVDGLLGGHSGGEITLNRGNANKIIGRILNDINKKLNIRLSDINGGTFDNVIPSSATADILIEKNKKDYFEKIINTSFDMIKEELKGKDDNIKINITYEESTDNIVMTKETADKVIMLLVLIDNGVSQMSNFMIGLPDTSSNLGVVTTSDEFIELKSLIRSSINSQMALLVEKQRLLAEILSVEFEEGYSYPGWKYNPLSPLSKLCEDIYKKMTQKDIKKTATHGGLECGIISHKIPNLDIISIGPNIYNAHSTQEYFSLKSVEKTFKFLLSILENSKELS